MNVQNLVDRIQEIDTAIINMTAQLNALQGHKAETSHWLKTLQTPEPSESETQVESLGAPVLQ